MKMIYEKLTWRELFLITGFYFNNIFVAAISFYAHGSSMRLGLFVSIFIFLGLALIHGLRLSIPEKVVYFVVGITLIVISSYVFSSYFFDGRDFNRFIYSLVFLIILLVVSIFFLRSVSNIRDKFFNSSLYLGFYFLLLIGFFAIFLQKISYLSNKSMLIFSEPSHYSIAFMPFLFYVVFASDRQVKNVIFLALSLVLGFFVKNLTMVFGIFIIILLFFLKMKKNISVFLLLFILVFPLCFLDLSYFTERIDFSSDNMNLSTLVYLSGWERAYTSLQETYGLGLGFQQLGVVGEVGEYQILIQSLLDGDGLNLFDGGTLASKVIAEFGFAGILLLFFYVFAAIKASINIVRGMVNGPKDTYFTGVFIVFSIELFVRGMGYFSISSFMFISSIYWLYMPRRYFNQ